MKKRLLEIMVCPACQGQFNLTTFTKENNQIKEGCLSCACGKVFPVIAFIPRILSEDLMGILKTQFPAFFLKHRETFLPNKILVVDASTQKKEKTSKSFGFEWEKFSSMRDEWKKNFDFYFESVNQSLFKSGIALEVGSGNGRHTFYASSIFKELISIDLSSAVDVAFLNNKEKENTHFIQADVYYLPFKHNFFDFVFCIGVLHHLPNPEEGFRKLVGLLRDGGNILIYLYHSFSPKSFNFYLLHTVNFFRRITIKLPHPVLYVLCYPIACLSWACLVLPYRFLFKRFIKKGWPLGAYADYSFFVMLNDTFDRFSAPIENRYSKDQVLGWYTRANLKDINILGGSGWRALGKK